jgi:hypothetical protein
MHSPDSLPLKGRVGVGVAPTTASGVEQTTKI